MAYSMYSSRVANHEPVFSSSVDTYPSRFRANYLGEMAGLVKWCAGLSGVGQVVVQRLGARAL